MFVRPIIEQTKGHFKILELLVITFGTGRLRHQARRQTFETWGANLRVFTKGVRILRKF